MRQAPRDHAIETPVRRASLKIGKTTATEWQVGAGEGYWAQCIQELDQALFCLVPTSCIKARGPASTVLRVAGGLVNGAG